MIPIYSHPTTVLFIDDDINYLKHLSLHLPHHLFPFILYNNPKKALDYILSNRNTTINLKDHWHSANPSHLDSCVMEIDIPSVYQKCYYRERFFSLSTIVVDYNMPDINGLEFLQKIDLSGVQKILLTGETDLHVAIEAFNSGIINQYIRKQDPNIKAFLINTLTNSQYSYFNHLSLSTIDALACYHEYPSAIAEKEFEIFFNKLIADHNIVEYYLLDTVGSFLMLINTGEIVILHTQNEDQTESYYLDIKELDYEYFSDEEKETIKNRNKIFCYKSFQGLKHPDPSLWAPYFCDAKKIQGRNQFYYSIEKNPRDLDVKSIIPFNTYLEDHQLVFD